MNFYLHILLSLILFESKQTLSHDSINKTQPAHFSRLDTATFAAGCFWATEAAFEQIKGVEKVIAGYSGGNAADATYAKIETGKTGHAECVQIYYDPTIISYEKLLDIFFTAHDPTEVNRQGPDVGPQYRSEIFYHNATQKKLAEDKIQLLNKTKFNNKIATILSGIKSFYKAESYHQDYLNLHKDEPYIQNVSIPKVNKVKQEYRSILK